MENLGPAQGAVPIGSITGVTLHLPQTHVLSPALNSLVEAGVVTVEPAREYLLDLFHTGGTSQIIDLRPQLALRLLPARAVRFAH